MFPSGSPWPRRMRCSIWPGAIRRSSSGRCASARPSPGWQTAFHDLAEQIRGAECVKNAGMALNSSSAPAWPGFRLLRMAKIHPESRDVFSLALEADTDVPIAASAPSQFITVRLPGEVERPPLLRSYSLSRSFDGARYRISIKQEPHGAADRYLRDRVRQP